jgi:hypothetical protein
MTLCKLRMLFKMELWEDSVDVRGHVIFPVGGESPACQASCLG